MTLPPVEPGSTIESASRDEALPQRWLLQVLKVRLRFLAIVLVAAFVVSQWPTLRGAWDRWVWSSLKRPSQGTVSSSQEYFCPMDPGVVNAWPAICPICNMDLVPRKKMDATLLPEGVIARMQFAPYRVQLAGIRTTPVEFRPLQWERTVHGVLQQFEFEDTDETSTGRANLGFEAVVPAVEKGRYQEPLQATVTTWDGSVSTSAQVNLVALSDPPRIRVALTDANGFAAGMVVATAISLPYSLEHEVLSIPESSVVDRGRERLVYVETMPGMFDGVAVELGPRCGSYYPVLKGVSTGQRVASAGAFLIDAETRLNPSLAAGYFGANSNAATPPPPPPPKVKRAKSKLSPEDQDLVDRQKICPVTEADLNAMGGPVPVIVAGRKVFICCSGCEERLKAEPQKYLSRIP